MAGFGHPNIYLLKRQYSRAHKQRRRFLELVHGNILMQLVEQAMRGNALQDWLGRHRPGAALAVVTMRW